MNAVQKLHSLAPDAILPTLPRGVWFSAVGEPLTQSEFDEARSYLDALNFRDVAIDPIGTWSDAKAIADASNWRREWWETEHAEEKRLLGAAAQRFGHDAVMQRLTHIMEGSTDLFLGPAAVASARAGVADSALARSAAGAASHSLHRFALATMCDAPTEHMFAVKFRLFLAGRWPLSINDSTFYIF